MANIYTTGPVHIYVTIRSAAFANSTTGVPLALTVPTKSQTYYLGTGEQAPMINRRKNYSPVMNDLAGETIPLDNLYQGESVTVSTTLTRWNEYALLNLDIGSQWNAAGARGIDSATDLGTAQIFEGSSFQCFLHFPYYSKAYGTSYNMPRGYHFYSCRQIDMNVQGGTKAKKRTFAFEVDRVYHPGTGYFYTYDNVLAISDTATGYLPEVPPATVTGVVTT